MMILRGDPLVPIVTAAAELKRAAPDQYDSFVQSIRNYAERCKDNLLAAGPDMFLSMQGKTQSLDQLAKKLEDCLQLDDQYRARK